MWDLPGPGLEPVSSALAGRFLTAAPPEKSQNLFFLIYLTDNSLFKIIIATMYLIIYLYMDYVYICAYVCLYMSEINDNNDNDTRDKREDLGIFCY